MAQENSKLGFQLRAWLEQAQPDAQVDLFLAGDAAKVAGTVLRMGGQVKMVAGEWVQATLRADAVKALDREETVRSVVFSLSPGRTLNDSMRVKAHVNEAHAGLAPLPAAYKGNGVLVGIIDTGIELNHPDFRDSLGNTRVLRYWDQTLPYDPWLTPTGYGYGQAWDSTAINAGNCPAVDQPSQWGHGTTVAATAAANSNGNGHCAGVAPEADLIIVSNNLLHPNWTSSVVDAVRWVVQQAAQLDRPVSINLSLGDYYGSHDGLDPAALMIDQILMEEPGRSLACAAGNSGNLPDYHLHASPGADTIFTWFTYNPNSMLNIGAVYFDLWADTADFSQVQYSVGADRVTNGYSFRGRIPFRSIQGTLGQIVTDTLRSVDGNRLGVVFTQAQLRGGQYHMEVYIPQPDSSGQLLYRFITTGPGTFDVWSLDLFGTSKMVTAVPDSTAFPDIVHYVAPDKERTIVDSWACSPQVITVGNYYNQQDYVDISGTVRNLGGMPGAISATSSAGPTRTGLVKPDVAAPGDATFGAGPLWLLQTFLGADPAKLIDSLHMRGGGTSIASPVVTGTAALLLEKCPRASNAFIRDAVIAGAFADSLSGAVPNGRFGHGKVNAFASLVNTNVNVPVTVPGPLCEGDSVLVSGPDFMYRYWWSNGQTQRDVWTAGNDTLVLTVQTPDGCMGTSDSLMLVPSPLPEASITVDGMTLTSSTAAAYQWFLEGAALEDEDEQELEVELNGHYMVQVTDSAGCSAFSDTVHILSVGVDERGNEALQVWPVPAGDRLHISGLETAPGAVEYGIWDAGGRQVLTGSVPRKEPVIPVHRLAAGCYVLKLHAVPAGAHLRFIKGR